MVYELFIYPHNLKLRFGEQMEEKLRMYKEESRYE